MENIKWNNTARQEDSTEIEDITPHLPRMPSVSELYAGNFSHFPFT